MDRKVEFLAIEQFLELHDSQMLIVNREYQRGEAWKTHQQKKLIDSVMRRYPLPVVYLHRIRREAAGLVNDRLEIIDGQQRLKAINDFHAGAFRLFDPVADEAEARFPRFLQEQECPWAGLEFDQFDDELKKTFLKTELPVAYITSENTDEVRDLFVRLQAGLPLTPQEKRDALPGDFNHFVLKLGGKTGLSQYPGQPFFELVAVPQKNRGGDRTLAAQISMLFLTRREKGPTAFVDITSNEVDAYYYKHVDFDASSGECQRLMSILDKLHSLLGDGKRPKLRSHIAIHLVLFLDDIWDEYTSAWMGDLAAAVDKYIYDLAEATKLAREDPNSPNVFWNRYGQWARTAANNRATIENRHRFFTEQMQKLLGPSLQKKDETRLFGSVDRQIIYYRDDKECQVCEAEVAWEDVEIHHVVEHHMGGPTKIENGALVHRSCHPKGNAAKDFAKSWNAETP